MRTLLSLVEAVSDLTKYNWGEVFEMSIYEFFAFLSYYNYKAAIQKRELEEWKRKNKIK